MKNNIKQQTLRTLRRTLVGGKGKMNVVRPRTAKYLNWPTQSLNQQQHRERTYSLGELILVNLINFKLADLIEQK